MSVPPTGTVDVWIVDLDTPAEVAGGGQDVLDAEERRRADRFVREIDGRRWARGREALRHILAGYAGRDAAVLSFQAGAEGKPCLVDGEGLEFNVSHSGALFALAVATSPLGVDVELIRPRRRLGRVVTKVFSGPSLQRFMALEPRLRLPVFYRGWTMKEAVLKCLGRGVFALGHIDLVLTDGHEPVLRGVTLSQWDAERARVEPLPLDEPGSWGPVPLVGSLACAQAPEQVRVRRWCGRHS